jgi:hypothetical protein
VLVDGNPLPVAVKIISDAHLDDLDRWRERWQRQAELLRSLEHPSLVRVREMFEGLRPGTGGTTRSLFLVMNWAEGVTLQQWVAARPRPLAERVAMVQEIDGAVRYLHSGVHTNRKPVLHRDLKPSNVIVDGDHPRLVDFGFARFDGVDLTMVGTAGFIAPEVAAGVECTRASDVYSLGAVAYTVLAGHPPRPDELEHPAQALSADPELAAEPDLVEAVAAMLRHDPAARPAGFEVHGVRAPGMPTPASGGPEAATTIVPAATTPGTRVDGAPDEESFARRWPVVLTVVASAVLLGGGGGAVGGSLVDVQTSTTIPPTTVTTTTPLPKAPATVGETEADARAAFIAAGVADGRIAVRAVDGRTEPIGSVITQSVEPGQPVAPDARVELITASHLTTMPNVVGGSLLLARQKLRNAGLVNDPVLHPYPPDQAVRVLAQSLDPGSHVDRQQVVTLEVDVSGE